MSQHCDRRRYTYFPSDLTVPFAARTMQDTLTVSKIRPGEPQPRIERDGEAQATERSAEGRQKKRCCHEATERRVVAGARTFYITTSTRWPHHPLLALSLPLPPLCPGGFDLARSPDAPNATSDTQNEVRATETVQNESSGETRETSSIGEWIGRSRRSRDRTCK